MDTAYFWKDRNQFFLVQHTAADRLVEEFRLQVKNIAKGMVQLFEYVLSFYFLPFNTTTSHGKGFECIVNKRHTRSCALNCCGTGLTSAIRAQSL